MEFPDSHLPRFRPVPAAPLSGAVGVFSAGRQCPSRVAARFAASATLAATPSPRNAWSVHSPRRSRKGWAGAVALRIRESA